MAVAHNGLCGSDLTLIDLLGTLSEPHPLTGHAGPQIMGHEFAGTIGELAEGVSGWAVGDRVTIRASYSCGSCAPCLDGLSNLCRMIAFHGVMAPGGGLSEFTAVPASALHRVPDGVSLELAALTEPLAVARHAIAQSRLEPGGHAVVLGSGPIGIAVALNLRALGVDVLLSELVAQRIQVARDLGFEAVDPREVSLPELVDVRTGGRGADVVFECAGAASSFRTAMRIVRARGEVNLVAMYKSPLALDAISLMLKEVRITSSMAYLAQDFDDVLTLMAQGAYPLDGWVSHIGLDEVLHHGFDACRDGRAMKVLVDL